MYSKSSPIALWYLYSYLGTLVMLPLLRKLAKAMNARDFAYLALVQIIFSGLIPIGQFVLSRGTVTLNNYFSIPLITSQNVFFVLMGYFIHKVLDQRFFCLRYVVMANLIAFAAVVVSCLATHYSWKITGAYTLFHKSLIAVPTCALFFSAKYLFSASRNIPPVLRGGICFLGGTTFGIYLLEYMLRAQTQRVFFALQPYLGTLPACMLWILVAVCFGCVITAILKQIPFLKNYLS